MNTHRILVVDDHLEMANTIVDYLGQRGMEARAASSAQEALDMLARETFDGLLTDLRM